MKRLWRAFQCRALSNHRWQQLWIEEEKAFECLDCHKRYFGDQPPDYEKTMTQSLGGGGG